MKTTVVIFISTVICWFYFAGNVYSQTTILLGGNRTTDAFSLGFRAESSIKDRYALSWNTGYNPNDRSKNISMGFGLHYYFVKARPITLNAFLVPGIFIFVPDGASKDSQISDLINARFFLGYGMGGRYYLLENIAFGLESRWYSIQNDLIYIVGDEEDLDEEDYFVESPQNEVFFSVTFGY